MADTNGAPRQRDVPSAAVLLHSMEYSLVRGDIWQYRRLRGQYHREYHVGLVQWRRFVEAEERLTRDSRITEPFRSGYFKCLVLQAARDTGLPDFWLLFWQCSRADDTVVEASHLMLKEAIPDTFEAIRLLPPTLETLIGSVSSDNLDEQWRLLASRYAPLGFGELGLGAVAGPAGESPGIWPTCHRIAELARLHLSSTLDGLQEAMAEVEATPEPTQQQVQALLAWSDRRGPSSQHIRISIIRRLQRHPRLEGSLQLTCALLTALCDDGAIMDPMIVEAVAIRSCHLVVGGDVTYRLMCIDLLHHIYEAWGGQQQSARDTTGTACPGRTGELQGLLRFWLQELLPRVLPPSVLGPSMTWDGIVALHIHIYGMLLAYCDDGSAIMQTYLTLAENLTSCHAASSSTPSSMDMPYLMTLMRIEAACRHQLVQESDGYGEAIGELIDGDSGTFKLSRIEELPEMIRLLLECPWDNELTVGILYEDLIRALGQEMLLEQYPSVALKILDTLLQDLTRRGQANLPVPTGRGGGPFRRLLVLRTRALSRLPECTLSLMPGHQAKRSRLIDDEDQEELETWRDDEQAEQAYMSSSPSGTHAVAMAAANGGEGRPELKVFLSNIPFRATEADLLSFLNLHRTDCLGVQLIRDAQGQSKGVGHATFGSEQAVQTALRLDRIPFEGRPLFISPYQPVPRSQRHRVIASNERNPRVLFLSHLPTTVTREELLSLLGLEATEAIVRLIPNKNIAYVECATEEVAFHCARTHDGAQLGDTTIRVQISDPQAARARAATLSMVPRGVRSARGARLSK